MTFYQALVAAGCEIDHHESDLYVKASMRAERILYAYPCNAVRFVTADGSGDCWWDVPFAYDPFWQGKVS